MTGGTPEVLCCAVRSFGVSRRVGHYFIWQLSVAASCRLVLANTHAHGREWQSDNIRNREYRGRRSEGISGPSTERKLWLVETSQCARPAVWYTEAKFILSHTNELDRESVWTPYVTSGAAVYQYEWWPPTPSPTFPWSCCIPVDRDLPGCAVTCPGCALQQLSKKRTDHCDVRVAARICR